MVKKAAKICKTHVALITILDNENQFIKFQVGFDIQKKLPKRMLSPSLRFNRIMLWKRKSRLLEKWFIAQKLGENAWFLQSEKNYYDYHQTYYNHIRRLGLDYEELNYKEAMPFLQMLPGTLLSAFNRD